MGVAIRIVCQRHGPEDRQRELGGQEQKKHLSFSHSVWEMGSQSLPLGLVVCNGE